ncbi:hypothetical protein ACWCP6_35725 [Streptomyces sp. NPDC002004]
MVRSAARGMAVTGLVLAPLLGAPAAAYAEGAGPAPTGSASAAARLEYVTPQGRRVEAGDALWFTIEGMPPGWDVVTVTSPALVEPIALTPVKKGATRSVQVDKPGSRHRIRSGLHAGTYPVTATSHGRTVATARLKVAAEGSAEIGRFVIGPKDAFPGSDSPAGVRPGSEVLVVLTDLRPAPGENSLTVTSPVFDGPLTLRTGSADDPGCKCDDGSTVYAGHTTVRDDVAKGQYTLTVVSHHGQQTTRQRVTVAGAPVADRHHWMIGGALAAGGVALVVGGGIAVRRRSRKAAASA